MVARIHALGLLNLLLLVTVYLLLRWHVHVDHKHITISAPSSPVVLYNRIPKTGSTTFTNAVAYDLASINGFNVIHVNLTTKGSSNRNRYVMSMLDQSSLAGNITTWTEKHPAFYHGHLAFVDFTRFGHPNPIYINIIREPLERFISYYYFLQYGDDYRVGLKRSRAGKNETFDGCFRRRGRDCDLKQMWLQIPYFCGTASFCTEPGNAEALEQAKWNMRHHYLIVGTTERMESMIRVLERLLPTFFNGAWEHFKSLNDKRAHLRHTLIKLPPSAEVIEAIKEDKIYRMEKEFYDAVVEELDSTMRRVTDKNGAILSDQYHYEKIRP